MLIAAVRQPPTNPALLSDNPSHWLQQLPAEWPQQLTGV